MLSEGAWQPEDFVFPVDLGAHQTSVQKAVGLPLQACVWLRAVGKSSNEAVTAWDSSLEKDLGPQ